MKNSNLIEKYLHGELDENERLELELKISKDPELANELEVQSVYYARRSSDLKKELLAYKPKSSAYFSNKIIISLLILIALSIISFSAYSYLKSDTSKDKIHFAQEYITDKHPAPSVFMGDQQEKALWLESIEFYNNANYNKAAESFSKATGIKGKSNQALFYTALSFLYSDPPQYEKAINILKQLINTDSVNAEESRWYLALAYYQTNDISSAEKLLEEIVTAKNWNHVKAKQLLEK